MEQSGTGSPESGNTFEGENTIKHPAVCDLYQSSLISDQLWSVTLISIVRPKFLYQITLYHIK